MAGWIKLHRSILDWEWYSDPVTRGLFIHLLLEATRIDGRYQGHELKAGQVIAGRKKLAQDLGFSEQQIRTALKKLENTGEITLKSTNKFTIVTVEKWALYQQDDDISTSNQPTSNQQVTNNQPTSNHIQESKNVRSKESKNKYNNILRHKYGEYENVLLTDAEFEKLKTEFPMDYEERIERLSSYMASTGKKYKSHLATIRNWAKRDTEKDKKTTKGNLNDSYEMLREWANG